MMDMSWRAIGQSLALDQYLQCHVKEFCGTLATADAYIQELRAENVQLKTRMVNNRLRPYPT
jgi:hypothetical protein